MLYWDKDLKERVFLNHKGEKTVQIQRLGKSMFPYFEFVQREEFDRRYEQVRNR